MLVLCYAVGSVTFELLVEAKLCNEECHGPTTTKGPLQHATRDMSILVKMIWLLKVRCGLLVRMVL